ncbi:MAG TPA: MFS transporter [Candidatus Limnocylindria bacterium]|nr:MFS transporter [Candidatus Limnocylindria bacterium]
MTVLAPTAWWRGLGSLTRSGSSVEGLAWALYDFANTIFSFAIVSFAMSLWSIRFLGEADGTFWFTAAVSVSVLLNAIVSPVLGAMSDRVGRRKPFLAFFTALCIGGTVVIGVVDIRLGLVAFALANFAYQAALIYYDAILPDVARPVTRGRLSGIGVALGYCGTLLVGVLLLLGVSTDPGGRSTPSTFLLVGGLFLLFAGPLFLLVREESRARGRFSALDAARSWTQLRATVRHARETPGLLRFIVARFFYSDPVNTAIAVMSAFAVHAVGFTEGQALQVLLILTVVAVIASFGWGFLADRWGPRRTLFAVLGTWALGLAIITLFLSTVPFLIAGAMLGAGLGGVGVVDRLMLLRLSSPDRIGEMFGLYGLAGKFSAVIGPIVYGAIVATLLETLDKGAYQIAIGSLFVLLLVGTFILRGVPEGTPENEEAAVDALTEGAAA